MDGLGAPTLATVTAVARGYGATVTAVHGVSGGCEVAFASAHAATAFATTMAEDWSIALRDPITDLWGPTTLTVRSFADAHGGEPARRTRRSYVVHVRATSDVGTPSGAALSAFTVDVDAGATAADVRRRINDEVRALVAVLQRGGSLAIQAEECWQDISDTREPWAVAFDRTHERLTMATELSYDEAEALGLDGTGRDGDARFPYTYASLTTDERARLDAYRAAQ